MACRPGSLVSPNHHQGDLNQVILLPTLSPVHSCPKAPRLVRIQTLLIQNMLMKIATWKKLMIVQTNTTVQRAPGGNGRPTNASWLQVLTKLEQATLAYIYTMLTH